MSDLDKYFDQNHLQSTLSWLTLFFCIIAVVIILNFVFSHLGLFLVLGLAIIAALVVLGIWLKGS